MSDAPIGVFDSGVGGLTVLKALREQLPHESFLYLGDTARLPYGTKSPQTVTRYAESAARRLVDRGVKMVIVACNTASAVALPALRESLAPLEVVGVVEPGADAAAKASKSGRIMVIATESTIRGGAYERAIRARLPDAVVLGRACPMFVALAEEGWTDGPVAEGTARVYLGRGARDFDTLVLGCTHFPVLRDVLARVAGPSVTLVDSAATTARTVAKLLTARGTGATKSPPTTRFLATDAPDRFARVGEVFLGDQIVQSDVDLVDL